MSPPLTIHDVMPLGTAPAQPRHVAVAVAELRRALQRAIRRPSGSVGWSWVTS